MAPAPKAATRKGAGSGDDSSGLSRAATVTKAARAAESPIAKRRAMAIDIATGLSEADLDVEVSKLVVENLPQGSRLSAGRNNGNRTWSLQPDEIHGLLFYPPDDGRTSWTLTVRVLGTEFGGFEGVTTVALFDVVVDRPAAAEPAESAASKHAPVASPAADLQLQ